MFEMIHACADPEPDGDGWYWAHCTCGFRSGPMPGREDMIDELIAHAYHEGVQSCVAS